MLSSANKLLCWPVTKRKYVDRESCVCLSDLYLTNYLILWMPSLVFVLRKPLQPSPAAGDLPWGHSLQNRALFLEPLDMPTCPCWAQDSRAGFKAASPSLHRWLKRTDLGHFYGPLQLRLWVSLVKYPRTQAMLKQQSSGSSIQLCFSLRRLSLSPWI